MNIKRSIASLILMLAIVLPSCAKQTVTVPLVKETQAPFSIAVEDYAGNKYVLDKAPEAIYVSSVSAAEIAVELGCARRIKMVNTSCADVNGVPHTVKNNVSNNPTAEKLKELSVDTAILNQNQAALASSLSQNGINVFVFADEGDISVAEANIRLMGAIFYKSDVSEEIISKMRADIALVKTLASKLSVNKKVYIECGTEKSPLAYGGDTLVSELVHIAGGVNVFRDASGEASFTVEQLQTLNPEVIISFVQGEEFSTKKIRDRKGYEDIYACKNGQMYLYGSELPQIIPAPSLSKALFEIAKILGTVEEERVKK